MLSVTTLAASALAVVLAAAPNACQPSITAPPDPDTVADAAGGGADAPEVGACPKPNGAVFDAHGEIDFTHEGTYGIEPGSACEAHLERWAAEASAQLIEGLQNGPVPRTWTVADTRIEGDRCVISLREVGEPEHVARRVSTPADCAAHPVGATYHTGAERGGS